MLTDSDIRNCDSPLRILLTHEQIGIEQYTDFLRCAEGGAVNVFLGTTRRFTDEKETVMLSYEAAEDLAVAELRRLLARTSDRWPVLRAVVVHRIGNVAVSEVSVLIGVATSHRADSFEACRYIIDELKRTVPIWKRESFSDGSEDWVEGYFEDQ